MIIVIEHQQQREENLRKLHERAASQGQNIAARGQQ